MRENRDQSGHPRRNAIGGNNPQWLVNRAADKIMAGELKVALFVGGEALYRECKSQQMQNWGGKECIERLH